MRITLFRIRERLAKFTIEREDIHLASFEFRPGTSGAALRSANVVHGRVGNMSPRKQKGGGDEDVMSIHTLRYSGNPLGFRVLSRIRKYSK